MLPIQSHLRSLGNPEIAEHSQRFFKTGPEQYGAGDKFLGIRVPVLRKTAKAFKTLPLSDVVPLLHSEFHEERLCALLILNEQFAKVDEVLRKQIFDVYLANTAYVNNWDLVDSSAGQIIGVYLQDKDRGLLHELAVSESLWERRIAIIATFPYIRSNDFQDALKISETLLADEHDLIHKAVGWMLREIGNRDRSIEVAFLRTHYQQMPRTMLRYAIEKFPEEIRQTYLKGTV